MHSHKFGGRSVAIATAARFESKIRINSSPMTREEAKCAAAKREIQELRNPSQTPRIRGLAIQPGTGTAGVQPIPANFHPAGGVARLPQAMSAEAVSFLSLRHFPAKLNLWQFSVLMGMSEEEVRRLLEAGILEPANEGKGTVIYFPLPMAMEIRASVELITELTRSVNRIYRHDNLKKKLERERKEKEAKEMARRSKAKDSL